jgi:hypothetical protein
MFKLKDLYRLYRQGDSTEFAEPGFIYRGSGALCLVLFFEKIFLPERESFTTDITEERLRFCLEQIDEGASVERAGGIRADLLAFLCFIHFGDWDPNDWSYLFCPEDERCGFRKDEYERRWREH